MRFISSVILSSLLFGASFFAHAEEVQVVSKETIRNGLVAESGYVAGASAHCFLKVLNSEGKVVFSENETGFAPQGASDCMPTNFNLSEETSNSAKRDLLVASFTYGGHLNRNLVISTDKGNPALAFSSTIKEGGGMQSQFIFFTSTQESFLILTKTAIGMSIQVTAIDWSKKKVMAQSEVLDCGPTMTVPSLLAGTDKTPVSLFQDTLLASPSAASPIEIYGFSQLSPTNMQPDFSLSFDSSFDGFTWTRNFQMGCGIYK